MMFDGSTGSCDVFVWASNLTSATYLYPQAALFQMSLKILTTAMMNNMVSSFLLKFLQDLSFFSRVTDTPVLNF